MSGAVAAGPPPDLWVSLRELGGFFELTEPRGTDAVPWADALEPQALRPRIEVVRGALAQATGQQVDEVDAKVAVSALQVGLASRVWSVALAGVVLHGWLPDLSSRSLRASPVHRGKVPLGVVDPTAGQSVDPTDPHGAAHVLSGVVVQDALAQLDDACVAVGRVSAQVLRSNTASSLVGAARVLTSKVPSAGPTAWALAGALLAEPDLATGGTVRVRADLPAGTGGAMETQDEAFMRRGCCLYDRLPEHGLCPDCVRAERRPDLVTPGH